MNSRMKKKTNTKTDNAQEYQSSTLSSPLGPAAHILFETYVVKLP